MKIFYKNKKVEKLCTNEKSAIKEYGAQVADKLIAAINILESAQNLKDILSLPQYHLHILKGNLAGIFSMYLGKTTGYRLLLIPLDDSKNKIQSNEQLIYSKAVCVEIQEVSKHYE